MDIHEEGLREDLEKALRHRERLREAIEGLFSPGLLGSQTDDDVLRDYGALGLSLVKEARRQLNIVREQSGRKHDHR